MAGNNPFSDPSYGLEPDEKPVSKTASNPFSDPEYGKEEQNTSLMGDLGTDLKRGTQQIPGIVTGLADVGVAALTNRRFVDETADKLGEATGFQPSKWAEEAREEYSPERQAGTAEIESAWEEGDALDVAGAYASRPGNVLGLVAESVPQMLVGGALGRGALVGGRAAGLIANPATAAQAARQAVVAGAGGEGAVIAGGTMNQIDDSVEPRRAAAAAAGAGVVGAALSGFGARLAQRAGLLDVDSALAGGVGQVAGQAPGLARRVAGGAFTEGVLEELPQSIQEQMLQNWAEKKPLMEGVPRAAVEGTLAGTAVGGAVNVVRRPSEQMGLDPNAGPLSSAAATAVDGAPSGSQTPVQDAARAAMLSGAPDPQAGSGYQPIDQQLAIAQELFPTDLDAEGNLHFYRYDRGLQTMVEVPEAEALAAAKAQLDQAEREGFDPQDARGLDEMLPQVEELPEQPPLATVDADSGPRAVEQIDQPLPLPTVESDTGPMDVEQVQAAPVAGDPNFEIRTQKNGRPFRGERDVRLLKLFNDLQQAGERPVVVPHEGGWAVAVPREPVEPPAPLGLPAPSTMVVDGQGNAQRGAVAPFVEPRAQVRPIGGPGMERQAPSADLSRDRVRDSGVTSTAQETQDADSRPGPVDDRAAGDLPATRDPVDNVARVPTVVERPATAAPKAEPGRVDIPAAVQGADGQRSLKAEKPPAARAGEQAERDALPDILATPRKRYIERQAKTAGIKKGSPGYAAAVARLEGEYENQVDDAQAALSFEQYNALNKESPEGVNRQAWEQLRKERGIEDSTPAAPKAKSIAGKDIDGDWSMFSKDSGSLNIPRADMPQIKAEHRGAMVNFLNARDIAHKEETIAADKLKPTQAEFSRKKVEKAKAFEGGDRSILISRDGHVLDGHHQWLAKREAGEDVKVIRLDAPIKKLLAEVAEFPSATTDDATAESAPQYSRNSYRRGPDAGKGARAAQLRLQLKRLTGGWQNAPDIKVVQSIKDLPDAQRRQVERDGAFDVEGILSDGAVYLVADNLRDVKRAAFVLQHEVLGHAGLQGAYGRRLKPLLVSLYNSNADLKQQADQLTKKFGYEPALAMEEVLADMAAAGTIQQQPFWSRLVAAMRNAMRSIGLNLNWSESDIQGLLANARRYIERGKPRGRGRTVFSRNGDSGRLVEMLDDKGRLLAPNGSVSKLNQKQWHQVRRDNFKRWFGDWQGLSAQQRLDAMQPLKLRMPDAWKGLAEGERLAKVKESLKGMARQSEPLPHDELGDVTMAMSGAKKAASSAADPAKQAVLKKLQQAFEHSIYASSTLSTQNGQTAAYHKLLAPIDIDGIPLVAVFTVREDVNGRMFYNTVTVDRKENALAVSPGDMSKTQGSLPANTKALDTFVRQPLKRVNPADVSKVTDKNGEPLVLYHGTAEEFNVFDQTRAGRSTGHTTAPLGIFLTNDGTLAKAYAEKATDGMPGLANVLPLFASIKKPYRMTVAESLEVDTFDKAVSLRSKLEREGYDGVELVNTGTWVAFYNNQVKSATNNTGAFDQVDPDIRYSRAGYARDLFNRATGPAPLERNDPFAAENRRLREGEKTLWQKAKKEFTRQFAPGGLLPDAVFAEKITRDSEFQAVEFDVRHLSGGLSKAVKADYGVDLDNLSAEQMKPLAEALAGKVDPSIPEATRVAIVAMRQYIDSLSGEYLSILQKQVEANMEGADQALIDKITGNLGSYVNRSYQAFDDPKWFKTVPTEVVNAARVYLAKGYMEQGETAAEAARLADVTVNEMLKNGTAYDSMGGFIAESKLGAKDLTVLIKRKEIAPEIRALLGEYMDPRLNFAKSATKMGRMVWNQRFLDRVLEFGMGTLFFEGKNRPADATTQIAGEQSESYAPLNGLWTFPEVAQSFQDALGKEQMSDLYRTVVKLNGMVKYGKTILSPTTAMRNWQSAMFFSLANGHFDLTQMKKSWAAMREQVTQNATGEDLNYLRKLKKLGVVYDTPYAGEMMALMQDARMDELLSSKSGTGLKWLRKANQFAQGFYSFGDDFWKIIGFENEKASLVAAGIPEAEAETMAAERIRNTYPTYSMIGKAVQWLRRFPLAGTFVSFPSEIIRTTVGMMKLVNADLKSDNPKIRTLGRKRAAGMAMVSAGFYALSAMTAAAFGVDDDEEEALRDLAAPWSKNSTFLYTGRDADGKLRYFDMSFLDPYGYWKRPLTAMMRDQPWQDAAASGISDMLSPFFGADITAGAIFEVLANKKPTGGQVYNENAGSVDQLQDISNHMRKALQPGFVSNAERLWLAGSEARREGSGQPYSMRDEVVSLLGWRAATLDTQTGLYYRSFDFTDALGDARKTLTRTLRSSNEVSVDDIRESKEAANAQYQKAFTEMSRLVSAAGTAGMSRSQIAQTLKLSGVAQRNIFALLSGKVPPMEIGMQAQAKAVQQARVMRDSEHAAEIARRFRLAREQ